MSHVMLLRFLFAINLVYIGIDAVCLTRFALICIFASKTKDDAKSFNV